MSQWKLLAAGGKQEVDGLAISINGPVQVFPLTFDLDVRLIHSPALTDRALVAFPKGCLQLRCELLNPAVDCGMVNLDPSLRHHFLQIPAAQWVS
jgi:hypothetical protein